MRKPVVVLILLLSLASLSAQPAPCLSLYLSTETAPPGGEVCLDVTAGAYEGLLGVLFELRWDTSVLAFKGVEQIQLPYLYEYNFNLLPEAVNNGYTVLTWYDPSIVGINLAERERLFSLCFEVVGNPGDFGQVRFAERNGVIELADANANAVDAFSMIQGGVYVSEQAVDAPLIAEACARAADCQGDNAIQVSVEGGAPPYTYEWALDGEVVAATPNLLGQEAGEYSLTVTDADGRQAQALFSSIPELYLQVEDTYVWSTSCAGFQDGRLGLLIGNGSGQYAYSWSNGETGYELDSLAAGTYAVTVTDLLTACTLEWQAEVYDGRPKPVGIEVEAAACNAGIGAIRLQMNGGNTFLWSNGADTEDIDSLSAGIYTVTITHELGCFVRSIEVPLMEGPYFTSTVTQPECGGNNGAIEVYAPGEDIGYHWNTGAQGPVLAGLPGGHYEVTVSAGDSCVATAGFELASDTLLAVPAVSCRADSSGPYAELLYTVWHGGQRPYTFSWSTGLTEVSSLSSTLEGVPDGTYTVSITDAAGCAYIVDTLVANCAGPRLEVELSTSCRSYADTAFSLLAAAVQGGGQGPYTFEWSNGRVEEHESFSQIAVAANGLYSVKVRDASGAAYEEFWMQVFCAGQEQAVLSISDTLIYNGGKARLDVSLGPVYNLGSLRLPLYWTSPQLRLDSIAGLQLPGLEADQLVPETHLIGGSTIKLLTLEWSNPGSQPASLEAGAVLFQLYFSVNSIPGQLERVRWGQESFGGLPRVLAANEAAIPLAVDDGRVQVRYYSNAPPLILSVEEQIAATGSAACLAVRAENFSDIVTAQFSMAWDPDTLSFHSIQEGDVLELDNSYFGLGGVGEGQLHFSWSTNAQQGLSIPAGAVLFSVCFETAPSPGYSPLHIVSGAVPIQASAYTGVLAYAIRNGGLRVLLRDVWPGDTDGNKLAGHFDLLHIGLAFNATGPPRPEAGTAWQACIAEGWWQELPRSGINYKHLDADGNGRIEAADTLAITLNWGAQADGFDPQAPLFINPAALAVRTPLYVQPGPVPEGQPGVFDIILGEPSLPAHRVYGLAFTICYDTAVARAGSASVSFEDSWLGENLLTLSRNRDAGDAIDVAITRTDRQNAFGFGPIAQLHLQMQEQARNRALHFRIENVRLLDKDEQAILVHSPATAAPVGGLASGTGGPAGAEAIQLYPNPARGQVSIRANGMAVERAELYDGNGKKAREWGAGPTFSLQGLPAGAYFLKVFTDQGVVVRPLSVVP